MTAAARAAQAGLAALLKTALAAVRAGRAVAYPTETLYGLGADAASEPAIARLLAWKGRAASQPLAILVESAASLGDLGIELPAAGSVLAAAFWPGPLTLVLPAHRRLAAGVGRADGAIGVRCSSHPLAAALAARLAREGVTITATSLNRTGERPARTRGDARNTCASGGDARNACASGDDTRNTCASGDDTRNTCASGGDARIACASGDDAPLLVDAAGLPEPSGVASTVVDLTTQVPTLLRPGAVPREALERALGCRLALAPEVVT